MDDKARVSIGVIGCGRQGGKTLAQTIVDQVVESAGVKNTVTWGDIKREFDSVYPNTAKLVDDYRPYAPYTIRLWLKTGVSMTYDYLTKDIQYL